MPYTITPTPAQDQLLRWMVAGFNKEHDLTLTVDQFLTTRFADLLKPFELQYAQWLKTQLQESFLKADPTTQAAILTSLRIAV